MDLRHFGHFFVALMQSKMHWRQKMCLQKANHSQNMTGLKAPCNSQQFAHVKDVMVTQAIITNTFDCGSEHKALVSDDMWTHFGSQSKTAKNVLLCLQR